MCSTIDSPLFVTTTYFCCIFCPLFFSLKVKKKPYADDTVLPFCFSKNVTRNLEVIFDNPLSFKEDFSAVPLVCLFPLYNV